MINKYLKIFFPLFSLIIVISVVYILWPLDTARQRFNGQLAFADVKYQVDLGPRTLGSAAHEATAQWIIASLQKADWQVETQEAVTSGQEIKNIVAKRGEGAPWVIIGSHYDSRAIADRDPDPANWNQATPGADDGASTVGILLELARVIPSRLNKQIWLVFFDAEDNGDNSGAGWDIGAEYFVSELKEKPNSVVILDMLGDMNLNIYMEQNSNAEINQEIWSVAQELGYDQFIPIYKYSITDDHIPFIKAGIRAVDVIDIDYPYWHTTQDTLDKLSAESLQVVGDTILKWLEQSPK